MNPNHDPRRTKPNCTTPFLIRLTPLARRAPAQLLGLAVAVVLLATLLAPLVGSPSGATAAQAEPVPTETADPTIPEDGGEGGEIPIDPADPTDPSDPTDPGEQPDAEPSPSAEPSPLPSPGPDSDDMPDADGTPDAGLTGQVGPNNAAIHVMMRLCDGIYGKDIKTLDAKCVGPISIPFDVYGGNVQKSVTEGFLSVRGLPGGVYTIREYVTPDVYYPTVFCGPGPISVNAASYKEVVTIEGYYEFTLTDTQSINCQYFHIAKRATGVLSVGAALCPENVPFDYKEATLQQLATYCNLYKGGDLGFDLTSHTGGPTQTRTTSRTDGGAIFDKVPVGSLTVTAKARDGYGDTIVWCDNTGAYQSLAVDHTSVTFEIRTNQSVGCDWFYIPDGANVADPSDNPNLPGTPEPSDGPEVRAGSLTVTAYDCPKGTGTVSGGYDGYAKACPATLSGVSFKLDGQSSGNPGDFPTDAKGQVSYGNLEADHFYLTESVPAGYGAPVAFCDIYKPLDGQPPAYQGYAVSAQGRMEFDLGDGEAANCAWFNIPKGTATGGDTGGGGTGGSTGGGGTGGGAGDPGTLTVFAYSCQHGVGCAPTAAGAMEFALSNHLTGETHNRAVGTNGSAGWDFADAGLTSVAAVGPALSGTPLVSCAIAGQAPSALAVAVTDVTAEFEMPAGQDVSCFWFNVSAA